MPDALELVHASGGLISPAVLADALSDTPARREFKAKAFTAPGTKAETETQHAETVETSFRLACELYETVAKDLAAMEAGPLRERWLIPLLELLDLDPVFQRAHLKSDDGRDSFAITHLGWQGADASPLVLVQDSLDDAPRRGKRSPHDELQQLLNRSDRHLWGICANATRLRVLRDFHHVHLKAFVGFDLDAIFETRDYASFRALYRLAHQSRFAPGEDEKPLLEALFEASQAEGVQVGRHLQSQVRRAIEALAEGLLPPELRALLDDPSHARELYRELLLVTYRILFLLFAEQRKMLPAQGLYAETYSIAVLARAAETRAPESHHCDLWEGLKATFRLLHDEVPGFDVFPYNGQLFDPLRTPRLIESRCENRHLLDAVRSLTHVTVGRVRQRVNYTEMGVEELGSVYESLLNYTLRRADQPTHHEGRTVPVGGVFLAPLTTERKDLGAYYTPPALVDFVLTVSLDKLIAERLEQAGRDSEAKETALLDLRVCDPACGSGAFLVGAIDRIALALADVRAGEEKPTEQELRLARRDALRHCIYGVDKDLFAVELCKVALWIHCAVPDLPLSFLDHRIQHGDSLVGWPLLEIPDEIPSDAYAVPSKVNAAKSFEDRRLRAFLREAKERNDDVLKGQLRLGETLPLPDVRVDFPAILAEDERIPADVARKTAAFEGYLRSEAYRRFRAAADLWTASFFWSPEVGEEAPTTADYRCALQLEVQPEQASAAAAVLEEFPAFHWPLRFPEIRARGGFDCFVGNPPWEQIKLNEEEWFAPRDAAIAAMRTADRREAIQRLRETNPELARRWRQAQVAYMRLAEYARNGGRFTASGHEPNTYLLFAELIADSLRPTGRAGVLLKSGLALDRSASILFREFVENGRIEQLHDHVNGGPTGTNLIFPAVDAKERFIVLGLRGPCEADGFDASVMNWTVEEGMKRPRQRFTRETLAILNPKTHTLTSFRKGKELEVALDIHRRLPILDFEEGGENPWGLRYHRLFDSSGKSHLFLKREDLEAEGWVLGRDTIFRRPAPVAATRIAEPATLFDIEEKTSEAVPLYEGQLANRYDHRARTYEGYRGDKKYGRSPGAPATTDEQKTDPTFEIEPRYWMERSVAEQRLRNTVGDRIMIGFRDVTRPWREQRSAKGAILPRRPATHKLPVFAVEAANGIEFLAVFNSTAFDFLARGHLPGASLALVWMLSQIPAPPHGLDERIGEHATRLSLTSQSVAEIFDREPHRWDPEERHHLDVDTDALIAHAYGLTAKQYEIVLDSFEVMARMQCKEHGRYKFKEDCLAAYRRLG